MDPWQLIFNQIRQDIMLLQSVVRDMAKVQSTLRAEVASLKAIEQQLSADVKEMKQQKSPVPKWPSDRLMWAASVLMLLYLFWLLDSDFIKSITGFASAMK